MLEIIDSNYRTDIIKGSKNTCIHWNMNNNKKTLVFLFINTHIYFLLTITKLMIIFQKWTTINKTFINFEILKLFGLIFFTASYFYWSIWSWDSLECKKIQRITVNSNISKSTYNNCVKHRSEIRVFVLFNETFCIFSPIDTVLVLHNNKLYVESLV